MLQLSIVVIPWLAGCSGEPTDRAGEVPGAQPTAPVAPEPAVIDELPTATYRLNPSAGDPAVPAELGGPGFTGEGWLTRLDTAQLGDPNAPQGGTLVTALDDWPATLRLVGENYNSSFNYFASELMYDTLLRSDEITLELAPRLATHWWVSDDKQTYRFRINPEARWSDGAEVTSEDVVATFELLMDPTLRDPSAILVYSKLDPPKAVSKYIVEVHAREDNWRNLMYFATQYLLPAHQIANLTGTEYLDKYQFAFTATSGPYEVKPEDIDTGNAITLTRRKDWWGEPNPVWDGWYNIEKFKFAIVKDPQLRFEKIKKHELDFMVVPKAQWWAEDIPALEQVQRGLLVPRKFFTDAPAGTAGLALNQQRPPLDDVQIRKALQLLYDRETMISKLFYDEYEPLTSYFQGSLYQNPANQVIGYDEVAAVALLEQAGWVTKNAEGYRMKDGKELAFTVSYRTPLSERMLTVYQEACQRAGIRLDLQLVTPAAGFKNLQEREYQIGDVTWGGLLTPNPETNWSSKLAAEKGNNNVTGFWDSQVDGLLNQYDREYDVQRRVQIIQQIDAVLYEKAPYVLGWYAPAQRVLYWNKFGMPPWGTARYAEDEGDHFLAYLWWVDPEKEKQLEDAAANPSIKLEQVSREVHFWKEWTKKHPVTPAP
ncbi:MAG: ABC transporter substrate-binding protein [Myxococcota bacterium]